MTKLDLQISPKYKLGDFCKSSTALSLNIDMTDPPSEVIENLKKIALKVEEASMILECKININSGWRPEKLNTAIGGSKTASHIFGLAVDIFPQRVKNADDLHNCFFILANHPTFMSEISQQILERGCIHLGLPHPGKDPKHELRNEVYTAEGKRTYPLIRVWGT